MIFFWQSDYKNWYHEDYEETPILIGVFTYLSYLILAIVGYVKDCLASIGIGHNSIPRDAPKHKVWTFPWNQFLRISSQLFFPQQL